MDNALSPLGTITVEEFLRDYWQKKPLLIRKALPGFVCPLEGDDLAGLALEEEVESRLVVENGKSGPWELTCGPFSEKTFAKLPKDHWTLLVQAVDHWVPEVAELRKHFQFLPSWRFDDIMFSYAPDGGSVGPHFDQYDVFLLQASGQRRWKIGQQCSADSPRLAGTDLDILENFEATDEWLVTTGDLLYIPPQLAHWGVAEGDDCITISVGFRAPSEADIVADFSQEVAIELGENQRYTDPALSADAHHAEIPETAIARLQDILRRHIDNPALLAQWFGGLMTKPKYPELQPDGETLPADWLSSGDYPDVLILQLDARLAFHTSAAGTILFANGEHYPCTADFARFLCDAEVIELAHIRPWLEHDDNRNTLTELVERRLYLFDGDDSEE